MNSSRYEAFEKRRAEYHGLQVWIGREKDRRIRAMIMRTGPSRFEVYDTLGHGFKATLVSLAAAKNYVKVWMTGPGLAWKERKADDR